MKRHAQPASGKISSRSKEKINSLVLILHSKVGVERERARLALVNIGKTATPQLIPLLQEPQEQVRWEACKALVDIADPSSATALVNALEDESSDVRWVASEALIVLGLAALAPLAQALIERSKSLGLRESARRILHVQSDPAVITMVSPLLDVLDGHATEGIICLAAEETLKNLR